MDITHRIGHDADFTYVLANSFMTITKSYADNFRPYPASSAICNDVLETHIDGRSTDLDAAGLRASCFAPSARALTTFFRCINSPSG